MRLLGILALIAGAVGALHAIPAALSSRRPRDLAWAIAAPIAVVLAIAGLVTIVHPNFVR